MNLTANSHVVSPAEPLLKLVTLDESMAQTWDQLSQNHPHSCFMQSWAWANLRELEGYRTFRYGLFAFTDDHPQALILVGGCIFYLFLAPGKPNWLYAPGGPLLLDDYGIAGMSLLMSEAQTIAQQWGAVGLRLEPLRPTKPLWFPATIRAAADLLPQETLCIDLGLAEAEILAQMRPKGRYNIGLSQRHGVTVEFSTKDQSIPDFFDIFYETVQKQKFFGEPYGFFIKLCQTLFRAGMAEIALARYEGEILAVLLAVYWGERCTYLYGGRREKHRHVMASYGLQWATMQRAKAKGCKIYDFYGYSDNPHHNYYRFSRFKRQFGGQVTHTIGGQDILLYEQLAEVLVRYWQS
ncbi:MAG: peptidoglycan bridge formation glycyltransferase FemA/FemB family protein [Pseudanabaena sp. ELA607]